MTNILPFHSDDANAFPLAGQLTGNETAVLHHTLLEAVLDLDDDVMSLKITEAAKYLQELKRRQRSA